MCSHFLYDTATLAGNRFPHSSGSAPSSNRWPAQSKHGHAVSKKNVRRDGLFGSLAHAVSWSADVLDSLKDELQSFSLSRTGPLEKELEERRSLLRLSLKTVTTLEEYRKAASELDKLEGNDVWKDEVESPEYNYGLIQSRLLQLEDARVARDASRILFLTRTSLTRNLGGMGNLKLYKHSRVGTKRLIERYIASALSTIGALLDLTLNQEEALNPRHVLEQVLQTRQAFGRSALLLSGGGTFGMNHIGVVKSLWESKLLPRIVSGSSAGSIVGSVLCTRTDDELPSVIEEFCYGDLAVFTGPSEDEGPIAQIARFLKIGAMFDITNLTRVMKGLLGDMTFQEAYNRTRRILNICVSSAGLFELPKLLNYVTAPNVVIWSAVAASCSVPLVFNSCPLLAKDPRTGYAKPWNQSPQRWIDGSVDNDIPMTRLAEMFNVNHFIVSQVNPHVVPFLDKEEEGSVPSDPPPHGTMTPADDGWFQKAASFAKDEAMHRLDVLAELGFVPNLLTKARSILSQRYSGHITILPSISYADFPKILRNPTENFMSEAMLRGERATWPKLDRIQNHVAIELALDDAVQKLRTRIAFSPSQVNLRMSTMTRPSPKTTRRALANGAVKRRQSSMEANGRHQPFLSQALRTESNSGAKVFHRQNHPSFNIDGLHMNTASTSHTPSLPQTAAANSEGNFYFHSSDSSDEETESPELRSQLPSSVTPATSPQFSSHYFPYASQPATPVQSRYSTSSSYFNPGPPSPIGPSLTASTLSMTRLHSYNNNQSSAKLRSSSPSSMTLLSSNSAEGHDDSRRIEPAKDTQIGHSLADSKSDHRSPIDAAPIPIPHLDLSGKERTALRQKGK